ncbi:MAG: Xaa-Pro dipeptidase [Lysobacterales bacterium]
MGLQQLYADHLREQMRRADVALERAGFDHLLIPSGTERYGFLDDQTYPFRPNPHFLSWLPLTQHPACWIAYTPGKRPLLAYYQPEDYWHVPPAAPSGFWVEHFDLQVIRSPEDAAQFLPAATRAAIIGEDNAAIDGYVPNNPEAALAYLHYHRARKTPYELAQLRAASLRGARGHLAAEAAFRDGASEHEIHLAFCAAAGHTDHGLPYANIVALNEHGAILHYHHTPAPRPDESRSFLIDAGGSEAGYGSDITRSYARDPGLFADLIGQMDELQQGLVAEVRTGLDYRELHLQCHHRLGGILQRSGIVNMSAEAQVERGVTSVFFPHGLGHFLGLQVHDVGGFQRDDRGGDIPRPAGHPYLRLTRTLEPGHVVTIEPGLYFIPMLLARLRDSADAANVDWSLIDRLLPFGGIRIEDDVHVTEGEPENLSRDAFRTLAA